MAVQVHREKRACCLCSATNNTKNGSKSFSAVKRSRERELLTTSRTNLLSASLFIPFHPFYVPTSSLSPFYFLYFPSSSFLLILSLFNSLFTGRIGFSVEVLPSSGGEAAFLFRNGRVCARACVIVHNLFQNLLRLEGFVFWRRWLF